MSPRRNWDSPAPSLASECAPPPRTKEGGGVKNRLRVRGWGSHNQFRRLEKKLRTLPTLCSHRKHTEKIKQMFVEGGQGGEARDEKDLMRIKMIKRKEKMGSTVQKNTA